MWAKFVQHTNLAGAIRTGNTENTACAPTDSAMGIERHDKSQVRGHDAYDKNARSDAESLPNSMTTA